MTDQEKNEAVARKLGWRQDGDIGWIQPIPHPDGFLIGHTVLPDYCRDIAAAWEVVKFLKPTHSFEINCWKQSWTEDLKDLREMCIAVFTPHNGTWKQGQIGEAAIAPMAIVNAFLKLHENSAI